MTKQDGAIALEENEREVLLGLVMTLVDADDERSIEEIEALKDLGVALGREAFLASARAARGRFPSWRAALEEARRIERPEARREIFSVLDALSMSDGLVAEEAALLEELAALWQVDWRVARNGG